MHSTRSSWIAAAAFVLLLVAPSAANAQLTLVRKDIHSINVPATGSVASITARLQRQTATPGIAIPQLRVIRATSAARFRYRVGTVILADRVLELRRGESLILVSLRTGRTYRLNGPARGTVAAMAGRHWMPDENRPAVRPARIL